MYRIHVNIVNWHQYQQNKQLPLSPQTIEHKEKTITYGFRNPGPGFWQWQTQQLWHIFVSIQKTKMATCMKHSLYKWSQWKICKTSQKLSTVHEKKDWFFLGLQ